MIKLKLPKPGIKTILVPIIMLLAACNATEQHVDTSATQPEIKSNQSWSVRLSISGGFAGVMRTISIDQTGHAIFTDEKIKSRVEKQVTQEDLQSYAKLVKILPVSDVTKARPSQCRDCFNYALVASYQGIQKRRSVDDITLQGSDVKELINILSTLASEMARNK